MYQSILQFILHISGTVPEMRQTDFFVIFGHLLPFYLLEIMKKTSGDVIILHMGIKSHKHMMHAS